MAPAAIRLIVFDIRGYKELRERLPVEKLLERKEKILKIIVDSLGEKEQFHGVLLQEMTTLWGS